jgi:hypothetical protein
LCGCAGGKSPSHRGVVGQPRRGRRAILGWGGRLATGHPAMSATFPLAAAGLGAAMRSDRWAASGAHQTRRQARDAQACQQACHKQMPDDDLNCSHNYPNKYTSGVPASLVELLRRQKAAFCPHNGCH